MKTINLRHCAHDDTGVDFSSAWPHEKWWNYYLAWLASTPRNWIERRMEPPRQDTDSGVYIIDIETPEEAGVQNGYPTAGLNVWWAIVCMDGAPERMKHQIESCRLPLEAARNILAPAEDRFRSLVTNDLLGVHNQPVVMVLGDWHDGVIVGYETESAARETVIRAIQTCISINHIEGLPWNWQFHTRAGIGLSVRSAFSGLLRSKRDQAHIVQFESHEYVALV